ncbi:hypothetical protein [Paenibacillus antibioticophila]|uniref:hypothetical protein n=1 Tax=Paenibacillus antibioticophila TaxID=1274374 RepID=UPI0005C8D8CA|nr:hypothetical protein [Paenibacillus antibioticophila]
MLNEYEPAAFCFELDLYRLQLAGADPLGRGGEVQGRMQVLHLKDIAVVNGQAFSAEVGQVDYLLPKAVTSS